MSKIAAFAVFLLLLILAALALVFCLAAILVFLAITIFDELFSDGLSAHG